MTDEHKPDHNPAQSMSDSLKSWVMIALTLIFVLLYIAALFGLIKPLENTAIINRLEPIIFVIIGYYFGRFPAQANENTLKNEISRQTQKADAAQQIKEKAQQERESLEEKIRNARVALVSHLNISTADRVRSATSSAERPEATNLAVETAVKILDS